MTRSLRGILAVAALVALAVPACVAPVPTAVPTAGTTSSPPPVAATPGEHARRTAGWTADLAAIIPGLERLHPEPYHGTSRVQIEAAIAEMQASIPTVTDDELMSGVLRAVAMVSAAGRDAHTGVFVWGTGSYPLHSLPLRLWLFPGGVGVIDALPPHEDLVGRTIVAVAGRDMGEVLALLDPVIPRDNHATVGLLAPRFLLIPEVLRGLGLIEEVGPVLIRTRDPAGVETDVTIEPLEMAAYNGWAGAYGLGLPVREGVPYLARSGEPLWFRVDGGDTLYVQYNRVTRLASGELEALRAALADAAISRVILDARHNYGGETSGYPPVVDALVEAAPRLTRGLYLVTGRNTFSAASLFVASLTDRTEVIVVGEPMGGSPTLYANAETFGLAWSGLEVTVATEYFETMPGDGRLAIAPALLAPLTMADFLEGRDPALAAIHGLGG